MSENLTEMRTDLSSRGEGLPSTLPKVSVIVPVYKVEKYLPECIESVLAQTFTDFELILVDDGSPDNSGKICDDYAARDSRIRVFHKENGGVTSARNLGLDNARGEWIIFVDSDDSLPRYSVEILFTKAKSEGVDVFVGRAAGSGFKISKESSVVRKFNPREYLDLLSKGKTSIALWAKIFHRNLFDAKEILAIPRSIYAYEDFLLLVNLVCRSKSIGDVDSVVYLKKTTDAGVVRANSLNLPYFESLDICFRKALESSQVPCWISIWGRIRTRWLRALILKGEYIPDDSLLFQVPDGIHLSLRERMKVMPYHGYIFQKVLFVFLFILRFIRTR